MDKDQIIEEQGMTLALCEADLLAAQKEIANLKQERDALLEGLKRISGVRSYGEVLVTIRDARALVAQYRKRPQSLTQYDTAPKEDK